MTLILVESKYNSIVKRGFFKPRVFTTRHLGRSDGHFKTSKITNVTSTTADPTIQTGQMKETRGGDATCLNDVWLSIERLRLHLPTQEVPMRNSSYSRYASSKVKQPPPGSPKRESLQTWRAVLLCIDSRVGHAPQCKFSMSCFDFFVRGCSLHAKNFERIFWDGRIGSGRA